MMIGGHLGTIYPRTRAEAQAPPVLTDIPRRLYLPVRILGTVTVRSFETVRPPESEAVTVTV